MEARSPERAILLLAGRGRRLGELTAEIPKCLLDVGGVSILERSLLALSEAGFREAILVVGYGSKAIRAFAGSHFGGLQIRYVENERFGETNTAYSLWLARDYFDTPIALIEGDIVFDSPVLDALRSSAGARSAWAGVPISAGLDEGILLQPGRSMRLERVELVRDPETRTADLTHKCAGIQFLDSDLASSMAAALDTAVTEGGERVFADLVLGGLLDRYYVSVCSVAEQRWAEVDDVADLETASALFARPSSGRKTGT